MGLNKLREGEKVAADFFRTAKLVAKDELDDTHVFVGDALYGEACSLLQQGDSSGARELLVEALAFFEENYSGFPLDMAGVENAIADTYLAEKKFDEAEEHVTKALKLSEKVYASENSAHPEIAANVTRLARIFHLKGDSVTSEALYGTAVSYLQHAASDAKSVGEGHVSPIRINQLYVDAKVGIASLLAKVEWNGKLRVREADQHQADAQHTADKFPAVELGSVDREPFWIKHNWLLNHLRFP